MNNITIPTLIAHRGASAQAPENTIVAMRKADELGAKWVEFDVQLTKCGQLVVIHDETLERTSNGHGNVDDFTLLELQQLDFGSWFDKKYRNTRIATLTEILNYLFSHNIGANIEIKSLAEREFETVTNVLNILANYPAQNSAAVMVSSFSFSILQAIRKQHTTVPIGFLMHEWLEDWQQMSTEISALSVNVNQEILTQERVKQIKQSNRLALSYTVNDSMLANTLFGWGVDGIFSDCPDGMLGLM